MPLIKNKVAILAPDFKPAMGGVAEYTYHLAHYLEQLNRLDRVITPVLQVQSYSFKVDSPAKNILELTSHLKSKNVLLKKFHSLNYITQLKLLNLLLLKRLIGKYNNIFPIVTWIISPVAEQWFNLFHRFHIPYGLVLHGKDIIVANQKQPELFAKICTKANLLIFNSSATEKLFQQVQPQIQKNSYILHPGIDINSLPPQSQLLSVSQLEKHIGITIEGKLIISSVCRLVKRKGIDIAIKALEPLLKKNQNLVYLIAGDGEEFDVINDLIEQLELSGQVKLLGNVSELVKYSILDYSSLFLMPNHSDCGQDFEGFGISFIEASYFQNVVIGGCHGGVIDAIKEGVNGFLVETESSSRIEDLRQVIAELLANPEEIERISKSAKEYVQENFQVEKLVKDFVQSMWFNQSQL